VKQNQQHNTILDLAAALKLSPATISRALNNTSYVKPETKQRVLEMAQKLGYRKNTMAAGLRNNKTNTVGLILPKISMYFHAAVVTVVQNLLHAQGYNLIIGQSNDDPAMEKELADTFFFLPELMHFLFPVHFKRKILVTLMFFLHTRCPFYFMTVYRPKVTRQG